MEWRNPRTKAEEQLAGQTVSDGKRAHIFLNARCNKDKKAKLDTLMHEFFHAARIMYGFRISKEEWCASYIGQTAASLLGKKRRNKNANT